MNFAEFRKALEEQALEEQVQRVPRSESESTLTIQTPSGDALAPHFHITEVGHVTKHFVDCGGVERKVQSCVLQTLVANDVDHRLSTDKLLGILNKSNILGIADDAPIELEIQQESISIYALERTESQEGSLVLYLTSKQTECLAPDKCRIPMLPTVEGEDCSGPGCC
ncbi:MAG: DUF6428 family protein [Pirellulaceae bacterium]